MKLPFHQRLLIGISYGFVPLGLFCLWAGRQWIQSAGGFLGLHLILVVLAGALPLIGLANVRRIRREAERDKDSSASNDGEAG